MNVLGLQHTQPDIFKPRTKANIVTRDGMSSSFFFSFFFFVSWVKMQAEQTHQLVMKPSDDWIGREDV